MSKLVVCLSAVLLAGCANLDQIIEGAPGLTVDQAVMRYGIPDDERVLAGYRTMIWRRSARVGGGEVECVLKAQVDGGVLINVSVSGANAACAQFPGG
jgi:hypothetical protein